MYCIGREVNLVLKLTLVCLEWHLVAGVIWCQLGYVLGVAISCDKCAYTRQSCISFGGTHIL